MNIEDGLILINMMNMPYFIYFFLFDVNAFHQKLLPVRHERGHWTYENHNLTQIDFGLEY